MMSQLRKLHLFNCDRTYKLEAVEDLLNETKAKLGFVSVEKHYFSLSQMSEMSTKTIPKLQMDFAIFVVHAHESRLSINEDNAGIGYAKIYRALLNATGDNVIIVIGGDDNYKNEDEEDRVVVSRWARRKIASQFNEEFLDGRKSFILSWNKKHREIHEAALLHYFDPRKKGQKFEYQLPKRRLPPRPITPPPLRSTEPVGPLRLYSSLPEVDLKDWKKDSFNSSNTDIARENKTPFVSCQADRHKGISQSAIWKTKPKDLAILGCSVSDESMEVVRRVFEDLQPVLNISTDTAVENCSPTLAKSYLTRNPLRFCVLVVDAKTVKHVYEGLPQRIAEYEDLLRTAVDKVVEKVIMVICGTSALSLKDEAIFTENVGRILEDTGKGFIVWVKHNLMTIEPDVLVQMIMAPAATTCDWNTKLQTGYQYDFSRPTHTTQPPTSVGMDRHGQSRGDHVKRPQHETCYGHETRWNEHRFQQPRQDFVGGQTASSPAFTPSFTSKGELIMLKTRLRFGKISYDRADLKIMYPGFEVPSHIKSSLLQEHSYTSETVIEIVSDPNSHEIRWSVDRPKSKGFFSKNKKDVHSPVSTEDDDEPIHVAPNETMVLITHVRYGKVSMKMDDVELVYPEWKTPDYLVKTLKREYCLIPDGNIYVVSDEKGNLRFKVHYTIGKKARAIAAFKNITD